MIKSFLIVVLGGALLLAALVTRPSEQSARAFLSAGRQPTAANPQTLAETIKNVLIKSVEEGEAGVPDGYAFKDRVLWVEVHKDGRPTHTGVLSHWFKHDPAATPAGQDKGDAKLASR